MACAFEPKTDVDWVDSGSPVEDTHAPIGGEDGAIDGDGGTGDGSSPDGETGEPDPIEQIDASALPAGPSPCRGPVLGRVVEITDGDTIKVETGRGIERVRLIGIDTPEVDHTGPDDECFGEEAKTFLSDLIKDARIWLTFDSECDDDYDRTLSYVHTETLFIQREMLQSGMASAYAVSPNTSFSGMFSSDEGMARTEDVGMWGECR